ncbi:MAG TPA: DNA gyrase C-terminal beta-propeller domain-containing protein, partial [Afifellaceae bacterium]|nr:DNA gyrase C-terminal beta-propeller domain-containing protein [Afifellaceae bacterium]
QIMLVSNGGQLIRVPVNGIRIAGRATKGVRIFNTAEDEKVVSVELVRDVGEDEDDIVVVGEDNAGAEPGGAGPDADGDPVSDVSQGADDGDEA